MASWEYFIYSKSGKYSPEDIAKSLIKKGYEENITCKAVTKQDVIVDEFEFLGSEFEANINISEGTEGLMFSTGAGDEEAVKKLFNVFQRRDIDVVMTAKLSALDYKSYFEDASLEIDGKTFFSELKSEKEMMSQSHTPEKHFENQEEFDSRTKFNDVRYHFYNCTFDDIRFSDSVVIGQLEKCRFNRCTFENFDAENISFDNSVLTDCKIINSNFRDSNFEKAGIYHSQISKSDFTDANFAAASIKHTRFDENNLSGVKFHGSTLDGVIITDATVDKPVEGLYSENITMGGATNQEMEIHRNKIFDALKIEPYILARPSQAEINIVAKYENLFNIPDSQRVVNQWHKNEINILRANITDKLFNNQLENAKLDLVDYWHTHNTDDSLREFLGLSEQEFEEIIADNSVSKHNQQQLADPLEPLPEIGQSNTKSDLYNFNFGTEKTLYVTEIENALSKLSDEEILKHLSDNQMQMLTEYNEFALDTNRKVDDRLLNLEAKAMQHLNKQEQMKIIQEFNPAQDNVHTWIRNSDEILTFEEALKDTAYEGWKGDGFDESYSASDAMSALETGRITVYSSHPIKQGVFVTPSAMEARSYSGDGKIYSKEVLIDEVAWVDPTQGQYANVQEFRKTSNSIPFSNNQSSNAYDGFSKGRQALDAERAASLQKNVDIDIKTYGEVQSTTLRYIEMYGFECVDGTVRKMQEQQSVSADSIDYSVTKPEAELKQQITPFEIDINQKSITKDEFEQLTSEIKNIAQTYQADPSLISEYMAFKAQFYDYSPNNTLLIHLQNPHATFVASFTKWKEMGYSIKKGEHHIKISRPIEVSKFPRDVNGKTVWTDVKYATSDEKARIASGDLEIQKTTKFIPHQVFDISQTTCPPEDYPKIFSRGYESIEQAQLYECIKEYAKDCGFTVTEENMSSIALHGYYDKADDSIHINSTLNDSKKLETMAHELAHGVLHKTSTQPTEIKEFEAESFGTMLKRKLGFPVSEESKRYIKNYFSESKFVTNGKFNMDETLSRLSKAFKHTSTGIDKKIEEMGYGSPREQGRSLSQAKAQAVDPVKISSNFTQAL